MLQPQWKYLIHHWVEVSWGTEYLYSLRASPIDHLFLRQKGTYTAEPWEMAPWPSDYHRWHHLSWGNCHGHLHECPVEGPQPSPGIPANTHRWRLVTQNRGPELFTRQGLHRAGLWNQDKVTYKCTVCGAGLDPEKSEDRRRGEFRRPELTQQCCIPLFCCCVSIR